MSSCGPTPAPHPRGGKASASRLAARQRLTAYEKRGAHRSNTQTRNCAVEQPRVTAPAHGNMCSHMTSDGSPYTRLKRAIAARNLALIHVSAAELPYVPLEDALGILLVIEAKDDERFERSAVKWAGRLALETPDLALAELAGALKSLHALPDEHAQRALQALAGRARWPAVLRTPPPAARGRDRRRLP
jgi:hypothetical protein